MAKAKKSAEQKKSEKLEKRQRVAHALGRYHNVFSTTQSVMEELNAQTPDEQKPFVESVQKVIDILTPAVDDMIRSVASPEHVYNADESERIVLGLEGRFLPIAHYTNLRSTWIYCKTDNRVERRQYCIDHIQVAQKALEAFEAVCAHPTLLAESTNEIKAQVPIIRKKLQDIIQRARLEVGKPFFTVSNEELQKWHYELKYAIGHLTDGVVQKLDFFGLQKKDAAPAAPAKKKKAKSVEAPPLRKRHAELSIKYRQLLTYLMVHARHFEHCYEIWKDSKDFHTRIKTEIEALGEYYQARLLTLADMDFSPTAQEIEEAEQLFTLSEIKLLSLFEVSQIKTYQMWTGNKEDGEIPALNKKYCIEYLKFTNTLLNRLALIEANNRFSPGSTEYREKVTEKMKSLKESLEKNAERALAEISKPVFEISRKDLSNDWHKELIEHTLSFVRDIAERVNFGEPVVVIEDAPAIEEKSKEPAAPVKGRGSDDSASKAEAAAQPVTFH